MMFNCKIIKTLAVIGEPHGNRHKRLSIASWNGGAPVFDLRTWTETDEGMIPCKGLTMTAAEAYSLLLALDEYFPADDEPQTEAKAE